MRVLFLTDSSPKIASARLWFYQMHELLAQRGIETSFNSFDRSDFDIIIVHDPLSKSLTQALKRYPNTHVGTPKTGYLGFPKKFQPTLTEKIANTVDFFLLGSFMWRELMLPYNRRVYHAIDYETDMNNRIKQHIKTNELIIGYHGNERHYAVDFFPHGANALKRLACEHDLTLKILTSDVRNQPRIEGIDTEFVEWELETFQDHLQTFDIGICPVFSNFEQLDIPYYNVRNPNRIITLLLYGIPSVTSPVPQSCHDLIHGETVLFAISEAGWYDALKRLITEPDLRNRIGQAGRKLVETHFSAEVAVEQFIKILEVELKQPLYPKVCVNKLPQKDKSRLPRLLRRAEKYFTQV